MSYDLFTFRLPPGADPSDYATEVAEAFDEVVEPGPSDPSVAQLIAAFRAVFPGADLVEEDEQSAMVLLEERLVSVDLRPKCADICVSYGVANDATWLTDLLAKIREAAADAGHDTLFDAQLDRPVDPSDPADAAEIGRFWGDGLEMVAELRAEHDGGGFFKRLFRRR